MNTAKPTVSNPTVSNPTVPMSRSHLFLCAWSISFLAIGFLSLWVPPVAAQPEPAQVSVSAPNATTLNPQTVLQELAQRNVVYLGETHDSEVDHRAQLAIIQALYNLRSNFPTSVKKPTAIALEMFQRPYQSVLDRYLAGTISESTLQQLSEYEKRWGYPWEYYAPILRFSKQNFLLLIALNTPSEVTRKVARSGLQSLTFSDRRFIPPLSAIRTEPDSYRERIRQIYAEIHQGKSNSRQFETFFQAQVLWDETMAERISQFLSANPNTQVIVLVGQGHLLYGDGIPNRVARRQNKKVTQSVVLINPPKEIQAETDRPAADYFWNQSS